MMSPRALNRALLARQMLLARATVPVVGAIERLVGLQAQVPRPPFIGLWTRLDRFRRGDLADALRSRAAVRATTMRATIHIMSAADYVALRPALQPALSRGMESALRDRTAGLDLPTLDRVARAFFGKRAATFDALRTHLRAGGDGDERAMAYAIRTHVPLVQVPTDDPWAFPAAADFTLADAWLACAISTEPSPADALVRRYLAAFGPATAADARAWSGLQGLGDVFERLRPSLVTFRDERKRELFDLPDSPRPSEDEAAPIRLIPEFDNLVLAHDDRTRVIADEHRPRVTLKNLQVRATFLVDGFVAGAWRVTRTKKAATLVLEPFGRLTKKTLAALEQEGEDLLQFVEPEAATRDVRVDKAAAG